jgi:ribonuclease HI
MLIVKTDGSFVGSPVNTGIGAFAVFKNGHPVHSEAVRDERITSSTVAEALAIAKALEWLIANGHEKESSVVASDSRSTLDVVRRTVKTRSGMLRDFCEQIIKLSEKFSDLVFLNCHRSEVSEAQTVARIALRPERKTIKEGRAAANGEQAPSFAPSSRGVTEGKQAHSPSAPRGGGRGGRGGGRRQQSAPPKAAPAPGYAPAPAPRSAPPASRPPAPVSRPRSPVRTPAPKAVPKAPPALTFLQQAALKKK